MADLALSGKTVLISGCNSGLGYETMRAIASRGASVIGTARDVEKAQAACRAASDAATGLACDLSDPASVRSCVAQIKDLDVTLDVIVCNAGIMALPKLELVHGYEAQFFVNHIGHFIWATALLDVLAENGRVIVLSSAAHWMAPTWCS